MRAARALVIVALLLAVPGCMPRDPLERVVSVPTASRLATWRSHVASDYNVDTLRRVEEALQEIRLHVTGERELKRQMGERVTGGSETIDERVRQRVDGRPLREVLQYGYELRARRLTEELAGLEDVAQERLIRKNRAHRTGLILDDQLKEPEAGPPRRPNAARQDFAGNSRGGARSQARDRQERRSIFVPQRKTQQQIFDREQTHALKIGGPPGAHPFDELQRCGQPVCARRGHCTITARPRWSSTC